MGSFGNNFGGNFAGILEVEPTVEPKAVINADLCVNINTVKEGS